MVSTKSVLKLALMAAVLGSMAACAEKPVPVAVTAPEPPAPTVPPPPAQPPMERPLPPVGIVPGSQKDFVVNVGDRVYFDTDQTSLTSEGISILTNQAAWLQRYPNVKFRIEGNADERGTREYNFALGARRAQTVLEFLVGKGIVPSRISTISYGKENPIDPGSTEDAWARNRNAHTTLTEGAQ